MVSATLHIELWAGGIEAPLNGAYSNTNGPTKRGRK